MNAYITYLKDSVGTNYLGIDIPKTIIDPFLEQLKLILDDNYDEYMKYKNQRDSGHFHITVVNVMDMNKCMKDIGIDEFTTDVETVMKYPIDDIKLMGIGTAEKNGNRTYFIVVNSDKLQAVRKKFNLSEYDFHITLAFKYKDVFGVRKNEVLKKIDNSFLKLLKKAYYNENESFDFIKRLNGYDGSINDEISPVNLQDTYLVVRVGNSKYMTISILNDELSITGNWESEENKPTISHTIISRKLA